MQRLHSLLSKIPTPFAGCDEVGRGCLAGPVVAAVVILPASYSLPKLTDSKKLTPAQRAYLAPKIKKQALGWAIGSASVNEIDKYNILEATFLAMHRAVDKLMRQQTVAYLLVDGRFFKPYPSLAHMCIVQGDAYIPAIAAASVIAKTYRDAIMVRLGKAYPMYGWERNKGYCTHQHVEGIKKYGITQYHRQTFAPCRNVRMQEA